MDTVLSLDLPVTSELVDRPTYRIKLNSDSEITELIIKADSVVNEKFVRETKKILQEARPGHKYYLLVGTDGFFRLTKQARKLGALKTFSAHMAAIGCYTTNYSLALLGELYNKINKPVVPTKVFYTKEQAREWLVEKINNPKHSF